MPRRHGYLSQVNAESLAAWEERLTPALRTEADRHGGTIPPLVGGHLFRRLSMETGCPDGVAADVARHLGLWESGPTAIGKALGYREQVRLARVREELFGADFSSRSDLWDRGN